MILFFFGGGVFSRALSISKQVLAGACFREEDVFLLLIVPQKKSPSDG